MLNRDNTYNPKNIGEQGMPKKPKKTKRKIRIDMTYTVDYDHIKTLILRRGLSIAGIARMLRCSRQAVYDILSKERHRAETINKLADVLGVQPWEILGDEESIIELEKKDKRRQKNKKILDKN